MSKVCLSGDIAVTVFAPLELCPIRFESAISCLLTWTAEPSCGSGGLHSYPRVFTSWRTIRLSVGFVC